MKATVLVNSFLMMLLAMCESNYAKKVRPKSHPKTHPKKSKMEPMHAESRTTDGPSVSGGYCNCFGRHSEENQASRCFDNNFLGSKPKQSLILECFRNADQAETARCKTAFLMHLKQVYIIDLATIKEQSNGDTAAKLSFLAELYQSHPSLEQVCENWESHGKTYIASKLRWIARHAFQDKDIASKAEVDSLNAAFQAPGWKSEVNRICKKESANVYCQMGQLAQNVLTRAVAFKQAATGLGHTTTAYEDIFNAFKLNFFLIKRNHAGLISYVNDWVESDENDILKKQMEIMVSHAKNVRAEILGKIISVLPSVDDIKDCHSSDSRIWCHFTVMFEQTRQLILLKSGALPSQAGRRSSQKKAKVIHTNIDYKELLSQSQAGMIWRFATTQSLESLNFAVNMKSELERTTGARFAELRQYFVKLQSFNYEKALADIAFVQGELDSYIESAKVLSGEVGDRVAVLIDKALGVSAAGLVERTVVLAECFLPSAWALDSDKLADTRDAIEGVGEQILDTIESSNLKDTVQELLDLFEKISKDFYKNAVFLEKTYKMLPTSDQKIPIEEFEKSKDSFLSNYNDYSPQVFENNIARLESKWGNVIDGACDLLEENDVIPATGLNLAVPTYCWEMKTMIQELIEMYSEIFDYQFELMDAMAAYIRAMTGYTSAKEISKDFDRIMQSEPSTVVNEIELIGMASYVTYEVQQQQAIKEYCDILTYKNGGKNFDECNKDEIDIAVLLSLEPAHCTFTYEYVDIPVKQRSSSSKKYGPDGKTAAEKKTFSVDYSSLDFNALPSRGLFFQVPDAKWLIKNKWIRKEEEDDVIYLAGLDLFLPKPSNKARHVVSETVAASKNALKIGDETYFLSPGAHFVFEYKEGQGASLVCAKPTIANPYRHCKRSHPPDICPLSKDRSTSNKLAMYPSIYSRFFISMSRPGRRFSASEKVAKMTIKAGVTLCKFRNKPDVEEVLRRKRQATEHGCCEEGQYWFSPRGRCIPCNGGRTKFFQSWCLK